MQIDFNRFQPNEELNGIELKKEEKTVSQRKEVPKKLAAIVGTTWVGKFLLYRLYVNQ
jgi:hypothetical protein